MRSAFRWFGRMGLVAWTAMATGGCSGDYDSEEPVQKAVAPIVPSFNTHDYSFYSTPKTWVGAQIACINVGKLVSIADAQENAFVAGQVAQHGSGTWWIGFNDKTTEGTFKWTGFPTEPVTFTNFNAGEPNNWNNEDGVTIDAATGKWNDLAENVQLPFVCERNTGAQPPTHNFTYNANDTNNATRNFVDFSVFANSSEGISLGTCGIPGASFSGDTFLRLFSPSGTQLALNDDACVGVGSNLSIIAPTTGWYTVRAGCFDSDACSGALKVRVEPMAPPGPRPPDP